MDRDGIMALDAIGHRHWIVGASSMHAADRPLVSLLSVPSCALTVDTATSLDIITAGLMRAPHELGSPTAYAPPYTTWHAVGRYRWTVMPGSPCVIPRSGCLLALSV